MNGKIRKREFEVGPGIPTGNALRTPGPLPDYSSSVVSFFVVSLMYSSVGL